MKPYIIKIPIVILFISIFALLINSCKKIENAANNKETTDYKAKAIQATIARYGRVTAPVIWQPNEMAPAVYYTDTRGNLILMGGTANSNRVSATCGQYNCSNAPTASDLYTVFTLQYVQWVSTACGANPGHDLTVTWSISVPYTLLTYTGNPLGPTYNSYGTIRIKTSGGSLLATSGNIYLNSADIVNLGADPGCSSNTLFSVSYTWTNISTSYFPGNAVDCALFIGNDCSVTNYSNTIPKTNALTYTGSNLFTIPCDRTDHAYVNPAGGGFTYANIAGAYVTCSPPSGFTGTDQHQVEYRAVTNSSDLSWDAQSSTPHGGVVPGTTTEVNTLNACCDVLNFLQMTVHSGLWLVRYRNVHSTGGCTAISGLNGNWGTNFVTEYWNLP